MNEATAPGGQGGTSPHLHKSLGLFHGGTVTIEDQPVTKIAEASDQLVSLDQGQEGGKEDGLLILASLLHTG